MTAGSKVDPPPDDAARRSRDDRESTGFHAFVARSADLC
jgi:hypothetical protein